MPYNVIERHAPMFKISLPTEAIFEVTQLTFAFELQIPTTSGS
jgi:hypothetical protein